MKATATLVFVALLGCRGQDPAALKASDEPPWGLGVPLALLAPPSGEPVATSLLQLIGSPDAFDGRRVRVIGFAHLEFEGEGLFLHREDFENLLHKNALWLDVPLKPEFIAFNGRYMIVEGTFISGPRGHFGNYSGMIKDVSRYDPMPTRDQLKKLSGSSP